MKYASPQTIVRLGVLALGGLLAGASQALAQTALRVGYVIVTPAFGDSSRLTAFETFRFRGNTSTPQASVLDSALATNVSLFVAVDILSGRNSGLSVVNPGNASTAVDLILYRANGSVLSTQRVVIPGGRQISLFLTELFAREPELHSSFTGLLNLISSSPVGVVALRFQDEDFSPVPLVFNLPFVSTVPPRLNGAGGPGAQLLPQFATGAGWASEIVLSNTSIGPITVRVDLFDQAGGPLTTATTRGNGSSFTGITIPPNGVVVLATK